MFSVLDLMVADGELGGLLWFELAEIYVDVGCEQR